MRNVSQMITVIVLIFAPSMSTCFTLAQNVGKAPSDDGTHEFKIEGGEVYHRIPGSRWGDGFWNINADQNVKVRNVMQVSGHVGWQKDGLNLFGVRIGGEAGGLNLLILTQDGKLWHVFRHSSDGPKMGHWTTYNSVTDTLGLPLTAKIVASGYVNEGPWPGFVIQEPSGDKHVLSYNESSETWHKDKFSMGGVGRPQTVTANLYQYEFDLQALRLGGTIVKVGQFSCIAIDDAMAEQFAANKLAVWCQGESLDYSTKRAILKSKTVVN